MLHHVKQAFTLSEHQRNVRVWRLRPALVVGGRTMVSNENSRMNVAMDSLHDMPYGGIKAAL